MRVASVYISLTKTNIINIVPAHNLLGERGTPSFSICGSLPEIQSDMTNVDNSVTETGVAVVGNAVQTDVTEIAIEEQDVLALRQHESRSLEHYLSRPVVIFNQQMTSINYTILEPLYAVLSSPRVRDKIRGYAYINARLHVKALMTAPLRSSGATIVSLHPWYRVDNGLGLNNGELTNRPDLCQLSQLPHILIDYSSETGGEIVLPIITPTNGLDLTDSDQIRGVFGLHISTFVAPQIDVGDSNAKPYLNILAWLTDVTLTGTTLTSELPTAQSEEYSIKPQNQPSTIKHALTTVYNKAKVALKGFATDLATTAIYALAGLSKPINLEPVMQVARRYCSPLANFNGMDSIYRLTGDVKQEVLVDSSYLGYDNGDEMDLMTIAKKPAILSFASYQTDLPPDSDFRVVPVSPCGAFRALTTTGQIDVFTPSPVAFCTLPFARWRGTLKFTFQAIGSSMMRGKFKVCHDAVARGNPQGVFNPFEFQALNNVVWDLSQSRKLCVEVPWASNLPFKPVPLLHDPWYFGVFVNSVSYENRNGNLYINPITPITDPAGNSITIILWVQAGDDFAWGDPRPVLINYTFAGLVPRAAATITAAATTVARSLGVRSQKTKTKEEIQASILDNDPLLSIEERNNYFNSRPTSKEDLPETQSSFVTTNLDTTLLSGDKDDSCLEVNITGLESNTHDTDIMLALCMGEKYTSIRQVIKRYTHSFIRGYVTPNSQGLRILNIPDRPIIKGWQGDQSINTGPDNLPCTYARDSLLSYFSVAFLGYRGGFNHKVVCNTQGTGGGSLTNTLSVVRSSPGYVDDIRAFSSLSTNINAMAGDITKSPDFRSGGAMTNGNDKSLSILEYNTPYNSRSKFLFAQDRTPQSVKLTDDGGFDNTWHNISVYYQSTNNIRIDKYTSAADDFSLFMYMYSPRMRRNGPVPY